MNTKLPDLPENKLKEIETIKQVIVDFVDPDKIILYGSYAKGKYVEQVYIRDGNKNYRPSGYEEGLLGTKLSYEFTSYKILDQHEAVLRADSNPFAVVVLTALMAIKQKGADDDTLQGIKRDLYFEMEARKMPKYTRAGIYDFLKYYVSFEDTNQFAMFHLA